MLRRVIDLVEDAGRTIEEIRRAGFTVEGKDDFSPVTEADRRADAQLREGLLALEGCGWLSEETGDDPARLDERRLWIVDPLDGTREFIAGVPNYAVAVALVEDGYPILAVVHCPPTGETWSAERGLGTHCDTKRLHVREGDLILGSRSEVRRGELQGFDPPWRLEPLGSIALKLAKIAAGLGAVTLSRGPKWEWDVCAGSLLIEEAGGRATELMGDPLVFNRPFPKAQGVLAGAPGAYERALTRLRDLGPSARMDEFHERRD